MAFAIISPDMNPEVWNHFEDRCYRFSGISSKRLLTDFAESTYLALLLEHEKFNVIPLIDRSAGGHLDAVVVEMILLTSRIADGEKRSWQRSPSWRRTVRMELVPDIACCLVESSKEWTKAVAVNWNNDDEVLCRRKTSVTRWCS
jgi:hypothetical protein